MASIRGYQPKDKERVRMICIATGGPQEAKQPGPAQTMQLTTYCDYYVECEPHNCFVIADDDDQAVGYILCAEEYWQYRRRFLQDYVPRVKEASLAQRMECMGAVKMPRFLCKKYPAHLHIDILPEYQRQGLGSQLMDTLTAHLRAKRIPAVMLGVGASNEKGRNFYQKYGFHQVVRIPSTVVMGLFL